jgi:hypothetical protein
MFLLNNRRAVEYLPALHGPLRWQAGLRYLRVSRYFYLKVKFKNYSKLFG